MSDSRIPDPLATTTGRRRRLAGSHPYPELPRSRAPLLRAIAWLAIAAVRALGVALFPSLARGTRVPARRAAAPPRRTRPTPIRQASLTPL
jgi:hypothetical protein